MTRLPILLLLVLLLLALACGGPGAEDPEARLLFDGDHAPDILLEERDIARPPALGGNRFLTGWWPWKKGKTVVLQPMTGRPQRVQLVHLGAEPRTLVLDFLEPTPPGGKVRARIGPRDLGEFPMSDPMEIRLPGDLPLGRVNVDLTFEPMTMGLVAGAIRPSLPGRAHTRGSDLIQTGDSLVDLTRRVTPGTTLTGTFVPPREARPGQRFDLVIERQDGSPVRRFEWTPSFWNGLLGAKDFSYDLRNTDGWVRIRLRSRGEGPPARWKGLALRGGEPVPEPAPQPARQEPPKEENRPAPRLVLVYVMDALRADTVGHLGGLPGVSPTLDRLAREGITFRNHRSVAPNTIPSTKALFTGRTFVSRGGWKLQPQDGATLAELFRGAGYRTGVFSGNVYISPAYATDRGFEKAAEEVLIDEYTQTEKPPFNDNAARAHAAALAWLRTLPADAKVFLYLHTIHPHNPYDPPEPYRSRYTRGIPSAIDGSTETLWDFKQRRREATEADKKRMRGLYTGSFAYNDAELAGFLRAVADFAPPEESLIALTADHGEEHFEHGGILHGFTLYEEQLRIPLVLWSPGRLRPASVDARTDTLDLHTSLIRLAGLKDEKKGEPKSDGRPLLEVAAGTWQGDYIHLASAASVKGGIYSGLHGRWKYVWAPRTGPSWGQGDGLGRSRDPEYLFDLEKDPGERVNLAGEGDLEAAWLRSRVLAWVHKNRAQDEAGGAKAAPMDPKTIERLRALGYVN